MIASLLPWFKTWCLSARWGLWNDKWSIFKVLFDMTVSCDLVWFIRHTGRRNHQGDHGTHGFLTMRSLSQTCQFLQKMMAKHHFYCVNKLLQSFHLEPDRIMSILWMTGGVISGSLVLFVMKIGTFKLDDIDFFINKFNGRKFMQ